MNTIQFNPSKCSARLDLTSITSKMNFTQPLPAKTCRSQSINYVADSCNGFYGDIYATGFIGPKPPGSGNGCYDHDFFRTKSS